MEQETQQAKPFDAARHLTLVSGKEYLEVKWRLVWLRSEWPDARIETELLSHTNHTAVVRAHVTLANGATASGLGMEDAQGFGDYLEKAETKAIGRALAALGYGTQFCSDFDFGAAAGRVVDSPIGQQQPQRTVQFNQPQQQRQYDRQPQPQRQSFQQGQQQERHPFSGQIRNPDDPATEAQKNMLFGTWNRTFKDLGEDGLRRVVYRETGKEHVSDLTKGEISPIIDGIKNGTMLPEPAF